MPMSIQTHNGINVIDQFWPEEMNRKKIQIEISLTNKHTTLLIQSNNKAI